MFAALVLASPGPARLLADPPRPSKPGKGSKEAKPKGRPPASRSRSDESNERVKEPTTFSEAFDRAYQSLDEAQAASVGLKIAKDQKTVDQEVLTRLEGDKKKGEQAAMDDFRLALALAGKGPVKDRPGDQELNTARYYLCFLCYEMGEFYDAAVLGEFLAHHAVTKPAEGDAPAGKPEAAPATAGARDGKDMAPEVMRREGAKIALTSYMRLYGESKQADKSFEVGENPRDGGVHAQALAHRGRSRGRGPGPVELRHRRSPAGRRDGLFGEDSSQLAQARPMGAVRRAGAMGGLSPRGPVAGRSTAAAGRAGSL